MTVKELHREAMRLTDLALIAKKSEPDKVLTYYKLAFEKEREAAFLYIEKLGEEPSRSILLRSAANLALLSNQYEDAEELAFKGLAGKPPLQVADELEDILEQINVQSKIPVGASIAKRKNGTVSKNRKRTFIKSSQKLIERDTAWQRGKTITGKNPNLYRKDKLGNVLFYHSYGKKSAMGWEIDCSRSPEPIKTNSKLTKK